MTCYCERWLRTGEGHYLVTRHLLQIPLRVNLDATVEAFVDLIEHALTLPLLYTHGCRKYSQREQLAFVPNLVKRYSPVVALLSRSFTGQLMLIIHWCLSERFKLVPGNCQLL